MSSNKTKTPKAKRPAARKRSARLGKNPPPAPGLLRKIGVFGYDEVEWIVLAALVTEDPLLLIGRSGTGKTYLLNSLSEALGLEHRHYNASMISFDDLVGFPHPQNDGESIRYIPTPATVWQAESVLVDEISRCKPEHQNRLFSLVHERRIQGLPIENLRYRWAAMNPCRASSDDPTGGDILYEGSERLDQALADRFAFVIEVPDWHELDGDDKLRVADPAGIGAVSRDDGSLAETVRRGKEAFPKVLETHRNAVTIYAAGAGDELRAAGIRISPRRVRQLARNLLGLLAVTGAEPSSKLFKLALRSSIPQPAWGVKVPPRKLAAAHAAAWRRVEADPGELWFLDAVSKKTPEEICQALLVPAPDPETWTAGARQAISRLAPPERAIVSFALYPVLAGKLGKIGPDGLRTLAEGAANLTYVNGAFEWQQHRGATRFPPKIWDDCQEVLLDLPKDQRPVATQFLQYLLANNIDFDNPAELVKRLNACIETARKHAA